MRRRAALENTERRTRVDLGRKPDGGLPQTESYRIFEALVAGTVGMECVEIEPIHAALLSAYVGIRLGRDVNDVRASDSRIACCQIDFARVNAMRNEFVAPNATHWPRYLSR
jgi:hypothetical protein